LIAISNQKNIFIEEKNKQFYPPPAMIDKLAFGQSEVFADLLWIRSIQDFSYCESEIAANTCKNNSWLFKMLDAITNLSPHFRMPYATGGVALSVLITDVEGAKNIFEKGVKAFPKDWSIIYRAAYHSLYEVKDKKRAAELLIQAGQNGAPQWVFALAGRLYSDSGNLELAESLLQNMIDTKQDEAVIERLRKKIASLKASNIKAPK
jgi:tetratricopeptide (TPR) repeat protein